MRNRVRDNKQSDYKVYNGEVKGYDKIFIMMVSGMQDSEAFCNMANQLVGEEMLIT